MTARLKTALYTASQQGHSNIVQMLLNMGADMNAKSEEFAPALFIASEEGHTDIVTMLLNNGADINVKSAANRGGTAIIVASQNDRKEIVKVLLEKGANVNATNDNGVSALQTAFHFGRTDIVKTLLTKLVE